MSNYLKKNYLVIITGQIDLTRMWWIIHIVNIYIEREKTSTAGARRTSAIEHSANFGEKQTHE